MGDCTPEFCPPDGIQANPGTPAPKSIYAIPAASGAPFFAIGPSPDRLACLPPAALLAAWDEQMGPLYLAEAYYRAIGRQP